MRPKYLYASSQVLVHGLGEDQTGGKAGQLAWLSRRGYRVPAWWVVTTALFDDMVHNSAIPSLLEALQIEHVEQPEPAIFEQTSVRIKAILQNTPWPSGFLEEFDAWFEALDSEQFWAVRSSVCGEDSAAASFAGQMDTELFQRGRSALLESIRRVMGSAFNARALMYRCTHQIPLKATRSAMILQQMIEGEVSGVLFSAHPLNGSRQHMLISACWGLGEGIVSGLCATDEFSVRWDQSALEVHCHPKTSQIVFDREQGFGTCERPVDAARVSVPCLADGQVLALRDLARSVVHAKGEHQDIEWTLCQGQFYILQSRPITRLPIPQDGNVKKTVFDNSNIQESYCGVTTPLTFSFASRAYATVYRQTMRILGVSERVILEHQDMLDNMLGLIRGRIYYNINQWYRGLLLLPSFKTNKADMERMMGLTDPVDFIDDKPVSVWTRWRRLPQLLRASWSLMRGFWRMDHHVQAFRHLFEQTYSGMDRRGLLNLSPAAIIQKIRELDRQLLMRWTTPILNDFYVMMMNGRVHRALVAAGFEQPSLLQNNLLCGEEGIESTEPTKVILVMSAYVRAHPDLRQLIEDHEVSSLLERIRSVDDHFYQSCLDYIERFGDRTIGELKLESVTLREDPSFLFMVLRNYLGREDLTLAHLTEREAMFRSSAEQEAFQAIRRQAGMRGLRTFRKNLTRLRAAIRNRENMRLARTRMFGLYRSLFLELGRQLAQHGHLETARDIFYLTLDELYALDDGRSVQNDLKGLIRLRRQEYVGYQHDDLPHHFHVQDMVGLHDHFVYPYEVHEHADGVLKGTGCYPGIVEAPVRVIFSPEDEMSLQGQILCTVRTDPGWAPLFPTAGGILVERGSTLSHSAVVARELGIPAIVGIAGLTTLIADGSIVCMDGSLGTVQVRSETSV